ncbi:MAG: alpha-galactosidase [Lachnospirales bacterium]
MPIKFKKDINQFHLTNESISYIMEVTKEGYLLQVYYGSKISDFYQSNPYPRIDRSGFLPNPYELSNKGFSLGAVLQEIPGYDTGDYREGLYEFTYPDGTKAMGMKYESHNILSGKKKLKGLPATYVNLDTEATSLEIVMADPNRGVKAILSYTIYEELPVITKSVIYINKSGKKVILNKGYSACIDIDNNNYEMIQFPGAWAREKQFERCKLSNGLHVLDSKRGSSSIFQQPFMALVSPETTEFSGEVRAFNFVYSGNFEIKTNVDTFNQTRVMVGINSHNFSWVLENEESFQTPEVVCVYSNTGLNGMSTAFHRLYNNYLTRGVYKNNVRPVLINNWEATYFDFNEDKLMDFVSRAKEIGVELFVLDDGWFGKRNSDTTSLGDWFVNKEKLPDGLKGLSDKVKASGMKFGLWFEPEMVSEESELFKKHPDWHIHVEDYPTSLGRNQLILDFSRQEVREEIYCQLVNILDKVEIDYIKWDMNRSMTEVGSMGREPEKQMETSHRYILGLYEILEKLTSRYPHILFENCSGGGGRFDPGMCYYMPQSWASDNTDAYERLKIQYSTSMIFPTAMICSQLSDIPNHQTGRSTPLNTRAAVAMSGNFGLMLNPEQVTKEDLTQISEYVLWYKENRKLMQFGDFYRLINPYNSNAGSWIFVSPNKDKAVLLYVQAFIKASNPLERVKLMGLDVNGIYDVEGVEISGEELMKFGLYINVDMSGDYQSRFIEIIKKN